MKQETVFLLLISLFIMNCNKQGTGPDTTPYDNSENEVITFCSARSGGGDIYVMEAGGSNPRRVTTNSGVDYWPAWSPDGSALVFSSDSTGNHEIYFMEISTNLVPGTITRLTQNTVEYDHSMWR